MPHTFSRPIRISAVSTAGKRLAIEANAEERAALAEANGLQAVESFTASLLLRREGEAALRVTGELAAEVVYSCVVTLEPVPGRVEEAVDVRFRSDLPEEIAGGEVNLEAEDPPEPAPGGVADIGAILAEFFTLGLDPYPRAPGAELPESLAPSATEGPFAALARLKGKAEGG